MVADPVHFRPDPAQIKQIRILKTGSGSGSYWPLPRINSKNKFFFHINHSSSVFERWLLRIQPKKSGYGTLFGIGSAMRDSPVSYVPGSCKTWPADDPKQSQVPVSQDSPVSYVPGSRDSPVSYVLGRQDS